jgi:hypothetical protein
MEIRNELASREIGIAKQVRAHLTYFDKDNTVVQKICPARWTYDQREEVTIPCGESGHVIVAFNKGIWVTGDFINDIPLPDYSKIEVRIIDLSGKDLLIPPVNLEFRSRRHGESSCRKI